MTLRFGMAISRHQLGTDIRPGTSLRDKRNGEILTLFEPPRMLNPTTAMLPLKRLSGSHLFTDYRIIGFNRKGRNPHLEVFKPGQPWWQKMKAHLLDKA